jgi:hypothetical protein
MAVGRLRVVVKGIRFVLREPDPHQVAPQVTPSFAIEKLRNWDFATGNFRGLEFKLLSIS